VANFTSVSEKLDPEEIHRIMDGCFKILMDEFHRYEGTINLRTCTGSTGHRRSFWTICILQVASVIGRDLAFRILETITEMKQGRMRNSQGSPAKQYQAL